MASGIRVEKRPLEEGASSASKASRVETTFSSLPVEMLENIVKYLPDADLFAMAQVDSDCRRVALHERVVRVFRAFPRELEQFAAQYLLPGDALAIQNVAERCLAVKQTLRRGVDRKVISLRDIDQSAQQLKETLIAPALIASIEGSPNPDARGRAVIDAARNGHLGIVRALLANGAAISEEHRGFAVLYAAENGHLDIVRALLANGAAISEEDRGFAAWYAARNGHLDIVRALLANGAISEEDRGFAAWRAARHGHLEIVQALLANGAISEHDRGLAVCNAAENGHLGIVQALLAGGATISADDRNQIVLQAAYQGHQEIADLLRQS